MKSNAKIANPKVEWLQRRLLMAKRTGNLVLANEQNVDLNALSYPEFSKPLSIIKMLDISRTNVSSLEGITKPFPKLATFIADRTQISDFKNLKVLSNVRSFSFKQTPVSKIPHYKLSILLCVGSKNEITSIDGQTISKKLKSMASEYPQPVSSELVNNGWLAEYPVPSEEKFRELCIKFNIEDSSDFNADPPEKQAMTNLPENIDDNEEEDIDNIDFEDLIKNLHQKHEDMLMKGQAMFGLITEDKNAYLSGQISSIFKSHGLKIDSNSEKNILDSVNMLCQTVAKNRSKSQISNPSSLE